MKAAARSQDSVVFLEHKALYHKIQAKTLEPGSDYILPFGRGRIVCEGSDVTIVTWRATVYS
jgi:2-oxoisovalerate dehydrogenase E1 component